MIVLAHKHPQSPPLRRNSRQKRNREGYYCRPTCGNSRRWKRTWCWWVWAAGLRFGAGRIGSIWMRTATEPDACPSSCPEDCHSGRKTPSPGCPGLRFGAGRIGSIWMRTAIWTTLLQPWSAWCQFSCLFIDQRQRSQLLFKSVPVVIGVHKQAAIGRHCCSHGGPGTYDLGEIYGI